MAIYGISNIQDSVKEFSIVNEILETESCFQDLIDKLDEFEENLEDSEYINESFVEDFKENFHYLVTRIRKGKEEMLKESTKVAREANEYTNELSNIVSSNKVKAKSMIVMEQYTMIYQCGNTTTYYTEYRKAAISGASLNFNNIFKDATSGNIDKIKKSYKNFKRSAYNIYRFTPYVQKNTVKGKALDMAKFLNNAIKESKDLTEISITALDNMAKSIENGSRILEQNKDSKDIKYVKKFLSQLKRLYNHDLNVVHQNNLRVMRQSRAARDFIKKNS